LHTSLFECHHMLMAFCRCLILQSNHLAVLSLLLFSSLLVVNESLRLYGRHLILVSFDLLLLLLEDL